MIIPLARRKPHIDSTAWVAPSATVVGDVTVASEASLWYGAVARADAETIRIGAGSNVQDGAVLHADPGFPCEIGAGVVVGHRAVLHGCTVEDEVLIGIGAIVMNGALVGTGSLIGAGALIPEGSVVPPHSLVLGAPGRIRRETTDEEVENIRRGAATYRELRLIHAAALDEAD